MKHEALGRRLSELERGLEGLLSCFESEPLPEREALELSWSHVLRTFEDVREELALAGARRAPHRESVERCLRLYALATGVLARRREEVAREREACANARQRLRALRREGTSGSSCDVRG